jgi:UDP-N-acetylmuramoyl-tripeptide--D-alanyl-D-alanine ligase
MAEPLWTFGDMAKAAHGRGSARRSAEISGISIDSRSLAPGEAFIALKGLNRDGHEFVAAALSADASCAIVEHGYRSKNGEDRLLRVADTLQALGDLGRAARERAKQATVIAVTGSVGKTGT